MSDNTIKRDALAIMAVSVAAIVGLGVARFAYALVLPDMRADLQLSYSAAGWLNTTNALGYLLGALSAGWASNRFGLRPALFAGTGLVIVALALSAVFTDLVALNAMRVLAGFGAGVGFVSGGVLSARIAMRHPRQAALLLNLFYGGSGLGIAISGLVAPLALTQLGPGSWRVVWAVLAAISLALTLAALFGPGENAAAATESVRAERPGRMIWMLVAYFCFGAGYIAYMTFMIAWLVNGGRGPLEQSMLWIVIGLAVLASPFLWSGVQQNFKGGRAFALLCAITGLGALIPLAAHSTFAALASGALFGSAFFSVVASTTVFVRRNFPPAQWASGVGLMTIVFGIGQMAGPILVGWLNDATGGMEAGLYASGGMLLLGALLALMQQDFTAAA